MMKQTVTADSSCESFTTDAGHRDHNELRLKHSEWPKADRKHEQLSEEHRACCRQLSRDAANTALARWHQGGFVREVVK